MRVAIGLLSVIFFTVPNLALCAALSSPARSTGMALLQNAPGVDVRSTLTLGDTQYYTPAFDPAPGFSGSLELDSYGSRYTGEYRPGVTLAYGGLLSAGDQLSLHTLGSNEEGHYHRLAYHLPIGPWGAHVGGVAADMSYHIGKELDVLDAHGSVKTASAFAVQPLIDTSALNVQARVQYDKKRLDDDIDLLLMSSEKNTHVLTYGVAGDGRDGLLGGGRTGFSLSWSEGQVDVQGLPYTLNGYTGDGHFRLARASVMRQQQLFGPLDLYASAQGQWTHDRLDDSEKFYLGGAYGVRAYPANDAPGDSGWLLNMELRYALTQAWQVATFVDHGASSLNAPNWIQDETHQERSAAGLVARWAAGQWHLSAVSAWKLGNNAPQSDIDRTPRVWAQLVRYF